MTLHPQIAQLLETLPPFDHSVRPDPAGKRAADQEFVAPLAERLPLHAVRDTTAATATGEVPVRIFTPVEADSYGVVVYFHGGAFFSGDLETHDHVARHLAKESGHQIVLVDFDLAPEAAFPRSLTQCYGVVRWVAETVGDFGDPGGLRWNGRTLAVAGDSSGGNFVAAVTAMAHDDGFGKITHQVLYYPSVDLDFDEDRYPSLRENATGYGLETPALRPWNSFYLESGADPADPLVSPIKRADLSGLPKALIITAGFDPLRDEGELYGLRLREAGVETTVTRFEQANHGFVQNFFWIPELHEAFTQTAEFLTQDAGR
ncbi:MULTISPECIES: alpha/beta hydrolase [Micrococcaceae]|jgi:acetyl esterase|uniref:alpha/beta hydrolase n=1 Tax=Micrococcaceae TaxID=1268 RepID=UPI0016182424|nr:MULTISPECIES: alpha/beta hydrolase [Micrococcaceae]MBB5748983.1 acetyl esterase [Micrococcus sp. TA1]HRO31503.1 alpha/beta hydrolase [Citricoccus sp.]HRO94831.1 alpha/beta hydrolase [Citricoccus sp.]